LDIDTVVRRAVDAPAVLSFILEAPLAALALDPEPISISPAVNLMTAVAVGAVTSGRVRSEVLQPIVDVAKRGLKVRVRLCVWVCVGGWVGGWMCGVV
jgi:hypothetical protein